MSKRHEVLEEYSILKIKEFNRLVEEFLDDKKTDTIKPELLKEAVSYFYLTLNEKEASGSVLSTTAYKYAENIFKHSTGQILTSIEMIGLSETQEKATKDVLKNIIRDGLWKLQRELSEGKWGQSIEL